MNGHQSCLVVGRPNVGKTLLVLNFADYCGVSHLQLRRRLPDHPEETETMTVEDARSRLVGGAPHQTRQLQSIDLLLPKGKGRRRVRLTDTTGLTDDIHDIESVRKAVAQTLHELRSATLVLHVLDAGVLGEHAATGLSEVDMQVSQYAPLRAAYAIIANKMDLPWASAGLTIIQRTFPHHRIVPVSALTRRGLAEVKAFVWDHL